MLYWLIGGKTSRALQIGKITAATKGLNARTKSILVTNWQVRLKSMRPFFLRSFFQDKATYRHYSMAACSQRKAHFLYLISFSD